VVLLLAHTPKADAFTAAFAALVYYFVEKDTKFTGYYTFGD
jgi:hypothetical protein